MSTLPTAASFDLMRHLLHLATLYNMPIHYLAWPDPVPACVTSYPDGNPRLLVNIAFFQDDGGAEGG
jgi:hypothetical protein